MELGFWQFPSVPSGLYSVYVSFYLTLRAFLPAEGCWSWELRERWASGTERGWQQGGTAPTTDALGPTCPGSAGSASPHEGMATVTLTPCLGDMSQPAAGRIGDAEH